MAQRRMTSLEVIDTDAFLDMPVSCQNLYFHLNARADDDGFVASPKKVVRALSASGDDLKVLIAKKFIIEFEDGVCVIKHWRVNNFIRKDIYKETQYLNLKQTLFIRPNGAYTTNGDERAVPVPNGHFKLEAVESALTERQLRIGKDREVKTLAVANAPADFEEVIVKDTEERTKPENRRKDKEAIYLLFSKKEQPWWRHAQQKKAALALFDIVGYEKVKAGVAFMRENEDDKYCPQAGTPFEYEEKLPALAAYKKRNGL